MSGIELEFTYRFEAAHRFTQGSTKCCTPHGHTWYARLTLTPRESSLDSQQMVQEFSQAKKEWKSFIQDFVDHRFFHHQADPILGSLRAHIPGFRGLEFPGDPTTEFIAALFLRKAHQLYKNSKLIPTKIELQETPTNTVSLQSSALETLLPREQELPGWVFKH